MTIHGTQNEFSVNFWIFFRYNTMSFRNWSWYKEWYEWLNCGGSVKNHLKSDCFDGSIVNDYTFFWLYMALGRSFQYFIRIFSDTKLQSLENWSCFLESYAVLNCGAITKSRWKSDRFDGSIVYGLWQPVFLISHRKLFRSQDKRRT